MWKYPSHPNFKQGTIFRPRLHVEGCFFFSLGNVDDYHFGWGGVAFCKSKMILGNVRCSKGVICRLALTDTGLLKFEEDSILCY